MRLIPQTWIGWLVFIAIIWFVITMPSVAGSDVHHFGHWATYALRQLSTFAKSI